MQNGTLFTPRSATGKSLPLRKLVDQLVVSLLPRTTELRTLIVNDISQELEVSTDQHILASVLCCLLYNTVTHSESNCIRISAKAFGYTTLVHVRNNCRENEMLIVVINEARPLAEKLGGCISVTNNDASGTTIAFTFLNPAVAA